jgi:hypothetical protein
MSETKPWRWHTRSVSLGHKDLEKLLGIEHQTDYKFFDQFWKEFDIEI